MCRALTHASGTRIRRLQLLPHNATDTVLLGLPSQVLLIVSTWYVGSAPWDRLVNTILLFTDNPASSTEPYTPQCFPQPWVVFSRASPSPHLRLRLSTAPAERPQSSRVVRRRVLGLAPIGLDQVRGPSNTSPFGAWRSRLRRDVVWKLKTGPQIDELLRISRQLMDVSLACRPAGRPRSSQKSRHSASKKPPFIEGLVGLRYTPPSTPLAPLRSWACY